MTSKHWMRPWVRRASWVALASVTGVGIGPAAAQDTLTAFTHVSVIPMDIERVLADQTVLVRGDRIVALGPAATVRIPKGSRVRRIDGRGQFLIPGLADMHLHLDIGSPNDPVTLARRIERDLFLNLANGVTTVRNLDYFASDTSILKARARAIRGEFPSPRIYTSGKWRMNRAQTIEQNLAAYKAAGFDFIKVHNLSGDCGEELDSLFAVARRLGIPIVGHVCSHDLSHALALGYASIEHLTGYPGGLNGSSLDADSLQIPELAAATQRAGVWNDPTLVNNGAQLGDVMPAPPEDTLARFELLFNYRGKRDSTGRGFLQGCVDTPEGNIPRRMVKALQDAGAGLLLGTDASPMAEEGMAGFAVHHELQAFVCAGLTPYQALATGTRNIAAYFGTLDSEGTVAVGKRADLVLLAGNPLADIRNSRTLTGVMFGGRWLPKKAIYTQLEQWWHVTVMDLL